MPNIKPPTLDKIADNGELVFASVAEVVIVGIKEGGLSIAPPVWMKLHFLQMFAMLGMFITQCSTQQMQDIQELMQQAMKTNPKLHM